MNPSAAPLTSNYERDTVFIVETGGFYGVVEFDIAKNELQIGTIWGAKWGAFVPE
jgi:hypothetical protein